LPFEIEAGGRVRQVTVTRAGDTFAVSVDGHPHQVDAVRIDAVTVSMIIDRRAAAGPESRSDGGRLAVYDAAVSPEAGAGRMGQLLVRVGSVPVAISMNGRRRGTNRGRAVRSGPLRIAAPMPGKIVRVLVRVGDPVRTRQAVVVIEAMKMENELRSDRDGTVAEVFARDGMTVESGAPLVVIQ
jgi:biotin carboxyl carrier protein